MEPPYYKLNQTHGVYMKASGSSTLGSRLFEAASWLVRQCQHRLGIAMYGKAVLRTFGYIYIHKFIVGGRTRINNSREFRNTIYFSKDILYTINSILVLVDANNIFRTLPKMRERFCSIQPLVLKILLMINNCNLIVCIKSFFYFSTLSQSLFLCSQFFFWLGRNSLALFSGQVGPLFIFRQFFF